MQGLHYSTLEEPGARKDSIIPWHCSALVTAEVLEKILAASLRDYKSLVANGYDKKSSTYSLAASCSGQASLDKWMNGHGYGPLRLRRGRGDPMLLLLRVLISKRPEQF